MVPIFYSAWLQELFFVATKRIVKNIFHHEYPNVHSFRLGCKQLLGNGTLRSMIRLVQYKHGMVPPFKASRKTRVENICM